jgi:hypothetical protein
MIHDCIVRSQWSDMHTRTLALATSNLHAAQRNNNMPSCSCMMMVNQCSQWTPAAHVPSTVPIICRSAHQLAHTGTALIDEAAQPRACTNLAAAHVILRLLVCTGIIAPSHPILDLHVWPWELLHTHRTPISCSQSDALAYTGFRKSQIRTKTSNGLRQPCCGGPAPAYPEPPCWPHIRHGAPALITPPLFLSIKYRPSIIVGCAADSPSFCSRA